MKARKAIKPCSKFNTMLQILHLVLVTFREHVKQAKRLRLKEIVPANQEPEDDHMPELALLGDGGETGQLAAGKSLVFAALEVCFCILVRCVLLLRIDKWGSG